MADTPDERRSVTRNIAWIGTVTTATKIAAAIAGVLSARLLGPADKGILTLSLLAVSVIAAGGFLGFDVWLLAAASTERHRRTAVRVLHRHMAFAVPSALVASVCLGALAVTLGWITSPTAVVIALSVVATVAFFPIASLLLASGSRAGFAAVMLVDCLGFLALLLAMAVLARPTVAAVILFFAVARGTAVGTGVWAWRRKARSQLGPEPNDRQLQKAYRTALKFGVGTFFGYVLTLATYRIDTVLLGGLKSAFDVGIYTAAAALVEFMWVMPDAAGQALVTEVARDPSPKLTARITRVTLAAMIVVAIGLTATAPLIVRVIYGDAYAPSARLIPPLAIAGVMLGLWKVIVGDLAGRGLSRPRAGTALVAVIAMLSSDALLIPLYGTMGAAIGAIIGYSLATALVARRWMSLTGGSARDLLVPRPSDVVFLVRRIPNGRASRKKSLLG